jgi:hypothetical protein
MEITEYQKRRVNIQYGINGTVIPMLLTEATMSKTTARANVIPSEQKRALPGLEPKNSSKQITKNNGIKRK